MTENEIASICVDAIYAVYKELGPGLLESIYQKVLLYELKKRGLEAVSELKIPIHYDGLVFGTELRADIVVDNKVILELKSVQELKDLHFKQTLTYLRLTGIKLGLLVNFNCTRLKDGNIRRIVNNL
ncbi:MAG: GxxExxY protein [Prevotella sp.]|nr:GxxExxY protein [Prevotella sp.]MCI7653144.1 GxxExxY protein [Bacteroidales bacterium]MDY4955503.1 GxxExxY protein [Prevotella sp.]